MSGFSDGGGQIAPAGGKGFEVSCDVLVIGAGAAGLIAALRAQEAGASVLVLERDPLPRGSTALSAGLVPAAETRFQREAGLADSKAAFVRDILAKAHDEPDPATVARVVDVAGPALEWLADRHGLPFSVIGNFSYPGHSAFRMHGLPSRSGAELMDRLRTAAEVAGIDIITGAEVTTLLTAAAGAVAGAAFRRPDGHIEEVGCKALLLACNGYGGDKALVAAAIPEMANALYFGHPGNQGDAVRWGRGLGAAERHLSGHQGHGSVAHPHGILISWATITEGGFQVNLAGRRFSNEARGYSEAAAAVLAEDGGLAWSVFDARIASIARQFEDFRNAEAAGAIIVADSIAELAERTRLPAAGLQDTLAEVAAFKADAGVDGFGRNWRAAAQLMPPYCAVRVTGALFHTQGGLVVDGEARVLRPDGRKLPNLFAAGGAACGVSGRSAAGYLSGNGLLTAVSYGFIAGQAAATLAGAGRFLCIGGAVLDRKLHALAPIRPATSNPARGTTSFGGVARNVAETLARLGGSVRLASCVGEDDAGQALLAHLAEAGVDATLVETVAGAATAQYVALLAPDGGLHVAAADMAILERIYGALARSALHDAAGVDWTFADCNAPAEALGHMIADARRGGHRLAIDAISLAKAARLPANLAGIGCLFLNRDEAAVVLGADTDPETMGRALLARGAERVVLTLGARGALACEQDSCLHVPAEQASVLDVTGAGDAMIAGVLTVLAAGGALPDAVRFGAGVAARTVASADSVDASLSSDMAKRFMAALTS